MSYYRATPLTTEERDHYYVSMLYHQGQAHEKHVIELMRERDYACAAAVQWRRIAEHSVPTFWQYLRLRWKLWWSGDTPDLTLGVEPLESREEEERVRGC